MERRYDLGRCIDCYRMVREGEGYSLNSSNQIECDACADKTDWHQHGYKLGSAVTPLKQAATLPVDASLERRFQLEDAYKEGFWDAFEIENGGMSDGQTNEQVEQCEAFWTLSQSKEIAEAEPRSLVDEMLEWLEIEISAIDTMYRGSPSYTRDAYWMKCEVDAVLEKAREGWNAARRSMQQDRVIFRFNDGVDYIHPRTDNDRDARDDLPTPEMLIAGSMVDWSKYASKEDAARDVWNAMRRNAPKDEATQ